MSISISPVLQKERIDILDVLRGFALLGVMIDNLFGFTGWTYFTDEHRKSLSTWPTDGVIAAVENIFVSGKFYSIFSLLFGIGFSIILIRNEQKGLNPFRIFYKRLFILTLFGICHILFLWEGDILLLYAIIGLSLPLFRKCSDRALLILAGILILSPILLDSLAVLLQIKFGDKLEAVAVSIDMKTGLPLDKKSYSRYLFTDEGGWKEWRNWQTSGWAYRYSYILNSNRIPKVLGMFLLGFYAGRKMMFARLTEYISLLKTLRFWGLVIGIPAGIASYYFQITQKEIPNPAGLLQTLFYATSVVPLCLAYTSIVCLYWMKKDGNTVLKFLAPLGRMALTNYIMQTVFGIFIYYGIGLGLGGNTGPSLFIPIGILVYITQIIYSNWWLKYFQYGPLEWIWRQLTYGKRLSLKK